MGGQTPPPPPVIGSFLGVFLFACLSERSVMYDDTLISGMDNLHIFLRKEKVSESPPPPCIHLEKILRTPKN